MVGILLTSELEALKLQLTKRQSGKSPSVTINSGRASIEALRKLPMTPLEIDSEVFGGKKLDGLIVSCLQPI